MNKSFTDHAADDGLTYVNLRHGCKRFHCWIYIQNFKSLSLVTTKEWLFFQNVQRKIDRWTDQQVEQKESPGS